MSRGGATVLQHHSTREHAPGLSYHLAFPVKPVSRACACQEVENGSNGRQRLPPDTGDASVGKHLRNQIRIIKKEQFVCSL